MIREFPGITDATVQAFDATSGGKFLAAYIVGDGPIDIAALRSFIGEKKPPYMVPEAIMQIDRIPLNQNQKVNKRELPKPEFGHGEMIPPQNDLQQRIFDIISGIIGHSDFGINTDIFEAGLTSINTFGLVIKISEEFSVNIQVRDFNDNDTVEKLETYIKKYDKQEVFELQEDYALTKTQEGIFFETQTHPGSTIYNIPILIILDEKIDRGRLKDAVVNAVAAHPYLKVRFFKNDKGEIVTNGGRVLGITALGDTLVEARAKAYEATEWIDFANKYMRHDIANAIL